jgi:hypothetical protein
MNKIPVLMEIEGSEERWHHQSLSNKERESTVLRRYLRTPYLFEWLNPCCHYCI